MMTRWALVAPLLFLLGLSIHGAAGQEAEDAAAPPPPPPPGPSSESAQEGNEDQEWGMNSLRGGFEAVSGYFDSVLEYMGGRDGVCQHRCRFGTLYKIRSGSFGKSSTYQYLGKGPETDCDLGLTGNAPVPRPGYKMPEPDGCTSYFFGLPLPEGMEVGIPAMTKCCNQLDVCYDTCGSNKYRCDSKFRWCLHSICSDLKKSLGFVSRVEACEAVADTLFNTVWTLGCKPYMNSQRAACYCQGEEKDEL